MHARSPTPAASGSAVASQSEIAERVGMRDEPLDRRVADPAARAVRDPQQRDGVVGLSSTARYATASGSRRARRSAGRRSPGTARPGGRARPRARATARSSGRRPRSRAADVPPTRRAARSPRRRSAPRRARPRPRPPRTGSPSPSSEQRRFGLRSRLFSMTALAAREDRVRRAVVLLERDHAARRGSRARSRGCCGCPRRGRRRSTGPGPRPRTRSGALSARSCRSRYCAWFVSWYSSTRT